MALSPNTFKNRPLDERNELSGDQTKASVPPAKIDEILLDALDAFAQTRKLHESTPNPETKRQTKRILATLHASIVQLAPFGIHSLKRLERVAATS